MPIEPAVLLAARHDADSPARPASADSRRTPVPRDLTRHWFCPREARTQDERTGKVVASPLLETLCGHSTIVAAAACAWVRASFFRLVSGCLPSDAVGKVLLLGCAAAGIRGAKYVAESNVREISIPKL